VLPPVCCATFTASCVLDLLKLIELTAIIQT